jgi:hypothetical protein
VRLKRCELRPRNSLSLLIQDTVEQARPQITQKLQMARSRISSSYDAWSSRSHLLFPWMHAHFVDENHQLATCLLALKHLEGRHTGDRLRDVLFNVLTTHYWKDKILPPCADY